MIGIYTDRNILYLNLHHIYSTHLSNRPIFPLETLAHPPNLFEPAVYVHHVGKYVYSSDCYTDTCVVHANRERPTLGQEEVHPNRFFSEHTRGHITPTASIHSKNIRANLIGVADNQNNERLIVSKHPEHPSPLAMGSTFSSGRHWSF